MTKTIGQMKVGDYAKTPTNKYEFWHRPSKNTIIQIYEDQMDVHNLSDIQKIRVDIDPLHYDAFVKYHMRAGK